MSICACVCIVCDCIACDYIICVNTCVCDYIVCIRDGSISTTSVNMNMLDTDLVLVNTRVVTFMGTL